MTTSLISAAKIREENTQDSKGERLFDLVTYGGIAGMGVFIATVPITDWLKHGGGAPKYNAAVNQLKKWGMRDSSAHKVVETSALMQGGNIGVLAVMAMEYFKRPIVRTFNALLGEKHPEEISMDAPQTVGSLIKARIVAWGVVYASFEAASYFMDKHFTSFKNACGRAAAGFMNVPTHEFDAVKKEMVKTKAYRYGETGALDIFATTAAAVLLYIGSNIFAKSGKKEEELKHRFDTPVPPADKKEPYSPETAPTEQGPLADARFTQTVKPQERNIPAPASSQGDKLLAQRQLAQDSKPTLSTPA